MKWIFFTLLMVNLLYLGANLVKVEPSAREKTVPVGEGRSLQFLSEKQGRSEREVEIASVIGNPTLAGSTLTTSACTGLGPFENIISAQDITERLASRGISAELTAVDTPTGDSDYRVVMAPLSSLQEAFRKLREFKSRSIDSYVITEGEDALGISLGVFSSEVAAEGYRKELADLGYTVLIKKIPRVNRGYWILNGTVLFPGDLLAEVAAEYTEVSVSETSCLN